jgi:hypothetical protein
MPWSSLGLREVEAPTFSDIRLIDCGKVVTSTTECEQTEDNIECWQLKFLNEANTKTFNSSISWLFYYFAPTLHVCAQ